MQGLIINFHSSVDSPSNKICICVAPSSSFQKGRDFLPANGIYRDHGSVEFDLNCPSSSTSCIQTGDVCRECEIVSWSSIGKPG